jgi:hypothetical protein
MVDESDEDVKERLANQTEHAKTKEEDTKWIILELHDDNGKCRFISLILLHIRDAWSTSTLFISSSVAAVFWALHGPCSFPFLSCHSLYLFFAFQLLCLWITTSAFRSILRILHRHSSCNRQ